jgi:hypothetical protein
VLKQVIYASVITAFLKRLIWHLFLRDSMEKHNNALHDCDWPVTALCWAFNGKQNDILFLYY